ncbi:Legume lectin domain [Sesbania bispinosa]|nr:Legume lectin domain [Sesbania bispinosa]
MTLKCLEALMNKCKCQTVIGFDSFANEWDPNPLSEFPHIGINVNSIESVESVGWKSNVEPDGAGALVRALIRYDSQTKELFVLVSYPACSYFSSLAEFNTFKFLFH